MATMTMPKMGKAPSLNPEPDQHAFIMLGSETLFLCHMTMLHFDMKEHMYQIVLRATLPPYAMDAYRKDQAAHKTQTYFLGNVEGDPMTVFSLHTGTRTSFLADIYRGIPERHVYKTWPWHGEKPLVKNVRVRVDREIYYRQFDVNLQYPQSLTYVLFGSGDEAHLTHYQVKEPDFDHILSLAEVPAWLPPLALEAGVHVNFPKLHATPVYCNDPFTEGKEYDVQYCGQPEMHRIRIGRPLWFSTKIVNSHNPCPDTASN